ncbi:MAG: tetratricopeptide repeat protein [Hyphomicrobiaceae bacterium]
MILADAAASPRRNAGLSRLAAVTAILASMGLGGCAGQSSDLLPQLLASKPAPEAPPGAASDNAPTIVQSELEKATEYWGKQFSAKPNDLTTALNYARNLKAMGQKRQALPVLQQASVYHGQSKELASEYGRLALELDQVSTAKPLLALADDPTKPDWRVISARGTVLAKEGNYKDAIPFFERALALSNNAPSVMNNLAMALALNGEADRSEQLLRQAAQRGGPAKVRQNLALVLGLQGKYDESTYVGSRDQGTATAQADTTLVRQMVRLEPKAGQPVPAAGAAQPTAVAANAAPAGTSPARPQTFRPTAQPEAVAASAGWQTKVTAAGESSVPAKPAR